MRELGRLAQRVRVTEAGELGLDAPDIRVAVRTGDTPNAERTRMTRKPPSFFVTTPESLYLLVTSASGRGALRTVEMVIVDEIHAVARDKRGSHLALTLERLEALCENRPLRVGLSATQRPIETVARLLVGERPLPQIVDTGHQRRVDLAIELPEGELEAVTSAEQMSDVLDRIAKALTPGGFGVCGTPAVYWPQGAAHGNELERHVEELRRENERLAAAHPVVNDRRIHDDRPLAGDRFVEDDRLAPGHPRDRGFI